MTEPDWSHPQVFRGRFTPQAVHIDGLEHTNNAVYVNWCEQLAWQHSARLGLTLESYRELDRAMAIVEANYQYLAASYCDDELELATCLSDCDGKMRLTRHFRMIRLSDEREIFRGCWQFRCIEISSGRPKRMPPQYLEVYGNACINASA